MTVVVSVGVIVVVIVGVIVIVGVKLEVIEVDADGLLEGLLLLDPLDDGLEVGVKLEVIEVDADGLLEGLLLLDALDDGVKVGVKEAVGVLVLESVLVLVIDLLNNEVGVIERVAGRLPVGKGVIVTVRVAGFVGVFVAVL